MHPSSSIPFKTAADLLEAFYGIPSVSEIKKKPSYIPPGGPDPSGSEGDAWISE
jgi:hypothetical protein